MENGSAIVDALFSKVKIPGIILAVIIFSITYFQRGANIKEINTKIDSMEREINTKIDSMEREINKEIGQLKVGQAKLETELSHIKEDISELKALILTSQKKR